MIDYNNKKVAILGLGVEGLTSAQFLQKKGAVIYILDRGQKDEIDQEFVTQAEQLKAEFRLGKEYLNNLADYDIIVRSPGFKRLAPELVEAEKAGVVITSQIKLFFAHCPCPIIGVTGTKGKGTTSTLIYKMLKEAGEDAYLGGNIGVPPLTFIEKLQTSSKVVLELSSFQLQDLDQSPHIAVMLMITSEHLDHHATVEEYIDAKRNMVRFQKPEDFTIVNRDYPASNESDVLSYGQVYYVSRERETENGCFAIGDKVIVRKNGNDDEIIRTSEIALPGRHNLENVCAAVMAARLAGVSAKHIIEVLKTFTGLEHRLELVREVDGVKYYDDSFSTTPETAIAAIEAFKEPKILILGGSPKESDFSDLGRVIRESDSIKAIIGIGDEWLRIKEALGTGNWESHFAKASRDKQGTVVIEDAENMKQVVLAATKVAKKGDVVLLSPGCASFGMFKNYKERGNQFKEAVLQLAK